MKGKLLLLILLIVGFVAFILIKFFIIDRQNDFGRLRIVSSPEASVFVDNVAIGKTPFEDKYRIGEFSLKLIPEGNATETASWQGKIQVYGNAMTYVNRELGSSDITSAGEIFTITKMPEKPKDSDHGEIYVETEPNGAIVYLDNEEKGIAPLILAEVLKGDHELSIQLPGFFRRTQKIRVEGGFRLNASFKMAVDESGQLSPIKPNEKNEASSSGQLGAKNFALIKETPTGWLRVREEPNLGASEAAKVNPGEKFAILEETTGWYKIKMATAEGWISSTYAERTEK